MNTLIFTSWLALSIFSHSTPTTTHLGAKETIEKSVAEHPFDLPLELNEKGLVRMQLRVDAEGRLEVLDVNYSHPELNELLVAHLASIQLDRMAANEVLYYEFSFKKQ